MNFSCTHQFLWPEVSLSLTAELALSPHRPNIDPMVIAVSQSTFTASVTFVSTDLIQIIDAMFDEIEYAMRTSSLGYAYRGFS